VILGHRHDPRVWAINALALLAGAYGVYQFEVKEKISVYVHVAAWSFLIYAFLSISYFAKSTLKARRRLELIMTNIKHLVG